ncbi:hypothetical protein IFM89_011404 [Coptis chinensis]|uniref:Uncharacterized protein n=1 Tax=Coptis chinensis TaxID=261450 RepID=A0A835HLY3_9MAGN|nr:hypothetical protein IFM89_011404 [Coptis chinensis]
MVNPWKTYLKLSVVRMGSHGLTKGSLAFLNYLAQLMFKSTKVLPIMVMGAFIPGLRQKYQPHEYVAAMLLVLGLVLFTLADAQTSPNFSVLGVIIVLGALIADSFLGNLQEAIFMVNPETTQMLFCSTVVGLSFLIPPMLATKEFFIAWNSCYQHDKWNTTGGRNTQAWTMFCDVKKEDVQLNAFTVSSVLKACRGMGVVLCGSMVHGLAVKNGVDGNMYVQNALMDMYATCSAAMSEACTVFEMIRVKNDMSWTTMIASYTHKGDGYAALKVFKRMVQVNWVVKLDLASLVSVSLSLLD